MAMARSHAESGSDAVIDDSFETCFGCSVDGKLQPATYFCFECGVYGRCFCDGCLRKHNIFVGNHDVEKIVIQSGSKWKKLETQLSEEREKVKTQTSLAQNREKQIERLKKVEVRDLAKSRLTDNRLADNNPDIRDLTDQNRPTKLAEKYAELYDNEWTDAFEAFDEHFHKEEKSIEMLLAVLKHIKEHCDKSAQDQADKLRAALMIRTDSYMEKVNNIDATMVQPLSDERLQPFVKGCVRLCWLMSVQDPPLVFGPEPKIGEVFDTFTYKSYTKTGAYIQYLVLPTLHLHEGGSLLSKGVAQGYGQALRNPGMSSRRERRRADTAAVIKESALDRPQTARHPQNIDRDENAKN